MVVPIPVDGVVSLSDEILVYVGRGVFLDGGDLGEREVLWLVIV